MQDRQAVSAIHKHELLHSHAGQSRLQPTKDT